MQPGCRRVVYGMVHCVGWFWAWIALADLLFNAPRGSFLLATLFCITGLFFSLRSLRAPRANEPGRENRLR